MQTNRTHDWYSNGVKPKDAQAMKSMYALIREPKCILSDRTDEVALEMTLRLENGWASGYILHSPRDISELMKRTGSYEVTQLEGKVVRAHSDTGFENGDLIRVISVNPNLIPLDSDED